MILSQVRSELLDHTDANFRHFELIEMTDGPIVHTVALE